MNAIKLAASTACLWSLLGIGTLCTAQPAPAIKQTEQSDRVTLVFRESPIQQVFEVLSRKDKVNIILGKGVAGLVSVNLYNVTVREAVYRVAEAAGLVAEYRDGSFLILDRKDVGLDHPDGVMQLRTFKVHYSDPKQVADILTKYLSRYGKITTLTARRMIVVEDTPEFVARVSALLLELDAQPKQVLIEARVLEITLDDGETYGVDWSRIFSAGSGGGSFGTNGLSNGTVAGGPIQGGFFFSLANQNLKLFLEAKSTKNRVRTLSTPKLLAMENQEAKAVVGKSTGYKVTTTINQVTQEGIQFLESGVILRVTPSVDQQGRVLLKVHPEVSSTTLNSGIPEKKSTEVTTELLCEDGQSVFIGGLIKSSSSQDKTGVPLLGELPGIGRLFSTTSDSVNNTETIVIITPRIVQDPRAASAFSDEQTRVVNQAASFIADQQLKMEYVLSKNKPELTTQE